MAFPFPVMAPISSTVLLWIPLLEIFHLVRYPNWQSAITGTGRDSFVPFPVLGVPFWVLGVPFWTLCAWSFLGSRTGTGIYVCGPISGTGLCQFQYGHFLGPVLELASMCVVPFPVPGSASSGMVIFWVLY